MLGRNAVPDGCVKLTWAPPWCMLSRDDKRSLLGRIFGHSSDWAVWNTPLGPATKKIMDRIFHYLAGVRVSFFFVVLVF